MVEAHIAMGVGGHRATDVSHTVKIPDRGICKKFPEILLRPLVVLARLSVSISRKINIIVHDSVFPASVNLNHC